MDRLHQARGLCARGIGLGVLLLLAGCASSDKMASRKGPDYGVKASPRVYAGTGRIDPSISRRGVYMVGKPYRVAGLLYTPRADRTYSATGSASWYGDAFHGRLTANGEVFDMHDISAAHPTMPLPSYARVTNLANGRSLMVRVNDRGPYHSNRVLDVSSRAADLLGFKAAGIGRVKVDYVGPAQMTGSDERKLLATLRTNGSSAPVPGSQPMSVIALAPAPRPSSFEALESAPVQAVSVAMPAARPALAGELNVAQARPVFASAAGRRRPTLPTPDETLFEAVED